MKPTFAAEIRQRGRRKASDMAGWCPSRHQLPEDGPAVLHGVGRHLRAQGLDAGEQQQSIHPAGEVRRADLRKAVWRHDTADLGDKGLRVESMLDDVIAGDEVETSRLKRQLLPVHIACLEGKGLRDRSELVLTGLNEVDSFALGLQAMVVAQPSREITKEDPGSAAYVEDAHLVAASALEPVTKDAVSEQAGHIKLGSAARADLIKSSVVILNLVGHACPYGDEK